MEVVGVSDAAAAAAALLLGSAISASYRTSKNVIATSIGMESNE